MSDSNGAGEDNTQNSTTAAATTTAAAAASSVTSNDNGPPTGPEHPAGQDGLEKTPSVQGNGGTPGNPNVPAVGNMYMYAQQPNVVPVPMGMPYGQASVMFAPNAAGYNGPNVGYYGGEEAMDPNAGVFDPMFAHGMPQMQQPGYPGYMPGQPDMVIRGGYNGGRGRGRGRGRGKRTPQYDSRWNPGGRGGHRNSSGPNAYPPLATGHPEGGEAANSSGPQDPSDIAEKQGNGHQGYPRQSPYHSRAAARDTGEVSSTNLYMRGLKPSTTDEELKQMCQEFGKIVSTKAIIDHETKQCKGYGFVMFESESAALAAIDGLNSRGVQATFAKITRPHNNDQSTRQGMHDPTNLYLSNLPRDMDENALSDLLGYHGNVTSCRVLRDQSGTSRGVALARMDTRAVCHTVIQNFNGQRLPNSKEPLVVKFADGPGMRKAKQSRHMDRRNPAMGMYPYYDPVMYDQSMWSVNAVSQPVVPGPYPGYAAAPVPGAAVPGAVPVVPVMYPGAPMPPHAAMNGGAAAAVVTQASHQQQQPQPLAAGDEGAATAVTSETGLEDMSSLGASLPDTN